MFLFLVFIINRNTFFDNLYTEKKVFYACNNYSDDKYILIKNALMKPFCSVLGIFEWKYILGKFRPSL